MRIRKTNSPSGLRKPISKGGDDTLYQRAKEFGIDLSKYIRKETVKEEPKKLKPSSNEKVKKKEEVKKVNTDHYMEVYPHLKEFLLWCKKNEGKVITKTSDQIADKFSISAGVAKIFFVIYGFSKDAAMKAESVWINHQAFQPDPILTGKIHEALQALSGEVIRTPLVPLSGLAV